MKTTNAVLVPCVPFPDLPSRHAVLDESLKKKRRVLLPKSAAVREIGDVPFLEAVALERNGPLCRIELDGQTLWVREADVW